MRITSILQFAGRFALALGLVSILAAPAVLAASAPAALAVPAEPEATISDELREALSAPLNERVKKLGDSKDSEGLSDKRANYSPKFRKVDDSTYHATMHVRTREGTTLKVERLLLTLKPDPAKPKRWVIANEEVKDTFSELHQMAGRRCYPFETFSFDRYGLKASATNGGVCEYYYEAAVVGIELMANDLAYTYTAPEYMDYYALQRVHQVEYAADMIFKPHSLGATCDPTTCDELLQTAFTGLKRRPPSSDATIDGTGVPSDLLQWMGNRVDEWEKNRKDNPFGFYTLPYHPQNRQLNVQLRKNDKSGLGVRYNNWGGFEIAFWVEVNWPSIGHQWFDLFGYYTDETLETTTPYELEIRDDTNRRWHEVYSLKGTVEAALEDPEMLEGDIDYGITIKQDLRVLPFSIADIPRQSATGGAKKPSLTVRSIQSNGEELTYVMTGRSNGYVIFPETLPRGTKLDLRIEFSTRAIYRVNHAFSGMARFGWMPFVDFGDFIDEFDLTIKTPAQYDVLGIGHKTSDVKKGNVRVTHWTADSPVVFPTIIFGKYFSDKPRFEAKKLDGTPIEVAVHVDEVSMMTLKDARSAEDIDSREEAEDAVDYLDDLSSGARGIRPGQLRSIAEQAANSINLYAELSGIDYPYGELNLVNDPAPALYGQAPSSLIYLGSMVFRGEGTMAGGGSMTSDYFGGGGGTGIAKFLKSVVAHEVGHQWWGSRVANANGRNYWFVETLAEYFSALYLEAVFGKKEYQQQVDAWRNSVLNADQKASVQFSSELFPGTDGGRSYQAAVYNKGPYAFHMLRQIFGDEKFFPFLKEFSQKLTKKGEVVTRDIQLAAEEALGGVDENGNPYKVDLEWFFDQWIRGVGMPEYRLTYTVRETEDGGAIIEGTIEQRVKVGNKFKNHVLEGKYYRALVPLTVIARKGKEYKKNVLVEGPQTPFQLKVPERPLDVVLNAHGESLALDTVVNKSW